MIWLREHHNDCQLMMDEVLSGEIIDQHHNYWPVVSNQRHTHFYFYIYVSNFCSAVPISLLTHWLSESTFV